jgi:UDP-N-acetylglucosamine--N-acetylmuramyl-(pentapeptide) pyrophosphoryl-undecaprenol N-acetylglucosamine transferase
MRTLMVMAGGTGGHVFPALAVASLLRREGVEVVWLGTRRGLEARAVPAAGIDVEWISIRGLRGKGALGWLLAPLRLLIAMGQTVAAVLRRRPDAMLGMGGFVAGPGGLVAWLLRRPLLIHEANAVAGLTNRWLAKLADRVLTGFPRSEGIDEGRAEYVGNPVREDIAALPSPAERLAGRSGALRLLVVGGSQGARAFNEQVPAAIAAMAPAGRPEVRHQCGRGRLEPTRAAYGEAGVPAEVSEFIDDMAAAYAWADLVVCRAGAMTVAELAAAGLPAVLVPYPHAVSDHQTANARFLEAAGAAVLLPEAELTAARLAQELERLGADRGALLTMAERARVVARPQATARVAQICRESMHA